MEILKAIILGIVEGVAEFLPISSTGHLILLNQVLSFEEAFTKRFNVIIQQKALVTVFFSAKSCFWPRKSWERTFSIIHICVAEEDAER